jgi:glutathione S-transferase
MVMTPKLTFYGARGAPNPRRVEIFMAEKGMREGEAYEFVGIDMSKGDHKQGGKYPTPNGKVPMLGLEDGTKLGESMAICRYLEETQTGTSLHLFGENPKERAVIDFWQRRIELELLHGAVGKAWIHGPVLAPMRKMRKLEGHASELKLGLASAVHFLRELDGELASRPYVAGLEFSVADITALCVIDFAAGPVQVSVPWNELSNLQAWHERVSKRSSVTLHGNPYIKGQQRYTTGSGDSPKPRL